MTPSSYESFSDTSSRVTEGIVSRKPHARFTAISAFDSKGRPYVVNKSVGEDGSVEGGGKVFKGYYKVIEVSFAKEMEWWLNNQETNQVYVMGVPADGSTSGRIAPRDAIESGEAPTDAIARSIKDFAISGPGYAMVDVDNGLNPEEVLRRLYAYDPGVQDAEVIIKTSSSYHIRNRRRETVIRKGSYHMYVYLENRELLPSWARALKSRLKDTGDFEWVKNKDGSYRRDYFLDFAPLMDPAIRECFECVKLPRGWTSESYTNVINRGGVGKLTKPIVPHQGGSSSRRKPASVKFKGRFNLPDDHAEIAEMCGLESSGKDEWVDPNHNDGDKKFSVSRHSEPGDPKFRCHHANHPITDGGDRVVFDAKEMIRHFVCEGDDTKMAARFGVKLTEDDHDRAEAEHSISEASNRQAEKALWQYFLSTIGDNELDETLLGEAARYEKLLPGQYFSLARMDAKHNLIGSERVPIGGHFEDRAGNQRPYLSQFLCYNGYQYLSELLEDRLKDVYDGSTRPAEGQWLQPEKIQKADMADIRDNVVVQAPMGAGKSEGADALIGARKALIIAPYRALTRALANDLNAGHYEDDKERLFQFDRVVVTPNSLHHRHIQEWLGLNEFGGGDLPDVVVYDEAATIASSVGAVGRSFLKEAEVNENISTLRALKQAGVQTVFMDAHVTPALCTLCDTGGVERYVTFDSEYEQPEVELHIVEKGTGEDGKTHETNPIRDLIPATGDVVVVSDSKSSVELMAKRHNLMPLHGKNAGDDEQRALLDDPEGEAKRRSESPEGLRVAYSPVLGAGWSNTSVEPVVVANYEGHISPLVFMQMLRRFRRPKGGKIHVQIRPSAFSPKRYDRETNPSEWLASLRKMCNPEDLNVSIGRDARDALRASAMAEEERLGESYAHALYVALKEDGFQVSVVENDALEADTAWKADKRSVKEREIDAVAEATVLSDQEMKALNRKDRLTSTEQKQKKATIMVQKLLLDDRDREPEKPGWKRDVVEAFIHRGLTKRLDRVWMARAVREDIDEHDDRMVHDLAVRTLEFVGVDLHKLHERGRKAVKAEEVDELLAGVRKVFGSPQAALAACERLGLPRLPKAKARKGAKNNWMRDWLQAFGLMRDGRVKKGRANASQWKLEAMVVTYLQRRIEAAKSVSSQPEESIPTTRLQETPESLCNVSKNKGLEEGSGKSNATAPDPLARAFKGSLPGGKKGRKKTSGAPQAKDRIGAIPTTPWSEWTDQQRIDALIVMAGLAQPGDSRFEGLIPPANDDAYVEDDELAMRRKAKADGFDDTCAWLKSL